MTPKRFNGKALYEPSGKAKEYSTWAVNFFTGCSNDCEYCYCKRGVLAHTWSTEPKLKKGFKDECHALDIFKEELIKARMDYPIKQQGILFSFTTDPMIPDKTFGLTLDAVMIAAVQFGIPVKILTKRADWMETETWKRTMEIWKRHADNIAFGFTLTGADGLEPNASTNAERIEAMKRLHDMGFKTFASIEPIIDPVKSQEMIRQTLGFCDLYKVGLISGKGKDFYNHDDMVYLWGWLTGQAMIGRKIYLKDSFLAYFGLTRDQFKGNFVNSDYNIFKQ